MGKVVLHIQKPKGNDAGTTGHIERKVIPNNADPERTHLNRELIEFPEGVENRTQAIQNRIESAKITRKISHNQIRALQVMLSGTHEDMMQIQKEGKLNNWCKDNIDWLQDTFGKENLVSAVIHLDEKTPHIHATVVPIVSGERRKAKAQKHNDPAKKKYKKKKSGNRLCADDLMARDKLKMYQDSYARRMNIYGLERGIDGSQARHISTDQYYRELTHKNTTLRQDIEESIKTKEELEKEIWEQKVQLKTEKLKNDVSDTISSLFSNTKLKKLTSEKENLEKKINLLSTEYKEELLKKDEVIKALNNDLKKSEVLIKRIDTLFPYIKELLHIDKICRAARFGADMIRELILGNPVNFKGDLYSVEYKRTFHTEGSTAQIKEIEKGKGRLNLFIDGMSIGEWCKKKYNDLILSLNPGFKQKQNAEKKSGLKL